MLRTALAAVLAAASSCLADGVNGYYRQPAIGHGTVVFVAEGDLWTVPAAGGRATRLTSHPGDEATPAISPDGATLAFTAQYEGPTEVYTMPLGGGLPTRRTFDSGRAAVQGWTPDGRVIATTDHFSTLPDVQATLIDLKSGARTLLPLSQCSDAAIGEDGRTVVFTRLPFNGSYTKRYKGGTAQNLWAYNLGEPEAEATPLTPDFAGTSKRPMLWQGRVYFLSDRDGTMNLWSMPLGGAGGAAAPVQHTHHVGFDAGGAGGNSGAALDPGTGRIVYQLGADLRLYDAAAGTDAAIPITLETDLDQERERWVKKPMEYVTSAHLSPDGDRVVLTARGHVFVFPAKQGRIVEAGREQGVRYRAARFLPDAPPAAGGGGAGAADTTGAAADAEKPGHAAKAGKPSTESRSLVTLSDESGEIELWTLPANGVGEPRQLTTDGDVIRWDVAPSPDGRYVAHADKKLRLWVYDTREKKNTQIDTFRLDDFSEYAWSADSRYLAYVWWAENMFRQVKVWDAATGRSTPVTTDRFDSYAPAFSPDGQWLYFLSDRNLRTVVGSPWGPNQPDPFLDKTTKVYQLALQPGLRSPFAPKDELHQGGEEKKKEEKPAPKPEEKKPVEKPTTPELPVKPELPPKHPEQPKTTPPPAEPKKPGSSDGQPEPAKPDEKPQANEEKPAEPPKKEDAARPEIDFTGIATRLHEAPIAPGNYTRLFVNGKALFFASFDRADPAKLTLHSFPITNESPELKTVVADVRDFELSADGKKILVRKGDSLSIIDAAPGPASDFEKKGVDLSGWMLSITPREEWRQMFNEAWRLERDYFYDPDMHGVNWKAMHDKYAPLVDRVASRAELSDILAQMIAELSALHMFVRGGDLRQGEDHVQVGALGALLTRDQAAGGYRIERIYQADPDDPDDLAPLARPGVDAKVGDVVTMIDGVPTLSVPDAPVLLRNKVGKQVLLHLNAAPAAAGGGEPRERDAIAVPISQADEAGLRYTDWEVSRRRLVEEWSDGQIGYLHLRAMSGANFTEFVRGFYPVFNRPGLIIDVRHNRGGNIDSWILSKLARKAWFYWTQRIGPQPPQWNMQYAFRGHMAAICNERTASDGEAFSEGFKRLGLGKLFGTRTWGGEIWLSSSNVLVDKGIATAAETGVYGPEGDWLIEGHGVEPDVTVDNPPHATFTGEDAQLRATVDYLLQQIREHPVPPVTLPKLPDKSSPDNR